MPSSTWNFTYDGNGNRTSDDSGIYSYVSNSNRLNQTPQATITLDAAGNTLSDGVFTYNYNQDGHLSQVLSDGNVLATYTYNHLRQRTRKAVNTLHKRTGKIKGTTTTVQHHDLAGNLIVETTSSGSLIRAYVWADGQPIALVSAGVPESLVYLHADHLGTPRLGTNGSGNVVWSWAGEAFGGTLPNDDPDGDSITTTVNLRFPGQYYDEETGLHYNWNRYYHPGMGRYIASDPIGLLGGPNSYLYANANAARFIDPFGLQGFDPGPLPPDPTPNAPARHLPPPPGQPSMHGPDAPIGPWLPPNLGNPISGDCPPYYRVAGGLIPFVGQVEIDCGRTIYCFYRGRIATRMNWETTRFTSQTYEKMLVIKKDRPGNDCACQK